VSEPAEPARSRRWEALGILLVMAFLNYMDRQLIFALEVPIEHALAIDAARFGLIATGFYAVYGLTAPLVGYVSDRMRRKTLLLVAIVSWSVVTALSGLATGFFSLFVFRAFTGLGEGGYFPTALSIIGDLFDSRSRGRAVALHGMFTAFGGSAGYALGGVIGARFGWRMPFLLAVVPGLLLSALLAWRLIEPPRGAGTRVEEAAPSEAAPLARPYWRIVLAPQVLLLSLAACAATFVMNGINTFLPRYLHDVRGFAVDSAGMVTGALYAATVLGQLSGGLLGDRLVGRGGGGRPLLVTFAFLSVAPAMVVMDRTASIELALVCYGATQLARGFAEPNIYCCVIDSIAARERGSALGFLLMLNFVGGTAGPLVVGQIIEGYGFGPAFDVLAALALVAGVLATTLVMHARRTARIPSARVLRQ
jgi:predicted MFS family arabinose efflux permease